MTSQGLTTASETLRFKSKEVLLTGERADALFYMEAAARGSVAVRHVRDGGAACVSN